MLNDMGENGIMTTTIASQDLSEIERLNAEFLLCSSKMFSILDKYDLSTFSDSDLYTLVKSLPESCPLTVVVKREYISRVKEI